LSSFTATTSWSGSDPAGEGLLDGCLAAPLAGGDRPFEPLLVVLDPFAQVAVDDVEQ
jgi:hypothetical protein